MLNKKLSILGLVVMLISGSLLGNATALYLQRAKLAAKRACLVLRNYEEGPNPYYNRSVNKGRDDVWIIINTLPYLNAADNVRDRMAALLHNALNELKTYEDSKISDTNNIHYRNAIRDIEEAEALIDSLRPQTCAIQ